jgi:hypothetical protein
LAKWLASVADGEKAPRKRGAPAGTPVVWLRKPDPGLALRLAMDMTEYHIPKLARTEINGELGIRARLVIRE